MPVNRCTHNIHVAHIPYAHFFMVTCKTRAFSKDKTAIHYFLRVSKPLENAENNSNSRKGRQPYINHKCPWVEV